MKRANNLIERIAAPENLRLAFWNARKGKTYAQSVEDYRRHFEANLLGLREEILTGLVDVGDYHYFKVYEPKERQICAAAFQEQVLHHALMNVCHPYFERHLVAESFASRKGKGTYAALDRAKKWSCNRKWFLKLDVRKFFESVHHGVVREQLGGLFKDRKVMEIFSKILDSYEASPGRGLPIGNLTSQYFANHYLSGLDHFIKERLRIKSFVRYMDDMILWSDEKSELEAANEAIQNYVETILKCALKPVQLNKTSQGVPFLGYLVKPYHVRLLGTSKRRFVRKFELAREKVQTGMWSQAEFQRHVLPLVAFTQHADTRNFRSKIIIEKTGLQP
jgi:RNA-directed DNA polymerase